MQQRVLLASLLMCGVSTQAFAQDAGSLLRDKERAADLPPIPRSGDTDEALPATTPPPTEAGETILIKTVTFSGKSSLLTSVQQSELAARVEGKTIGLAAIRDLAEAANTALRQNGLLLARAIVPPQDATGGTLTIEIVEASVEDITFEYDKNVRVRKALLTEIANREINRQSLTKYDLEAALLRMSDMPGVTARSRLAPGQAAGTSRVIVDVTQDSVVSGSLHADNFGSPSTGRLQGHAQLALADLTGDGDLTRLGLSVSEGQRYASASVAVPLSASELLATFDYAYLFFENVDDVGKAAGLEGDAHYASMGLTYRAVRSRDHNLNLSAELNGKVLKDDSTAGLLSDKRVYSGTLGLSGDNRDTALGGGITQYSLSWTFGDLDLSNLPGAAFVDALTLKTQGKFHRVNLGAARLQKLPGDFSLLTQISGQWASKNLDSSESFSLGGPYGVRGWPVGEGRGDMGFTASVELKYDVPVSEKLGSVQLSGFVDSGRVWINENSFGLPPVNACGCNEYTLSSVGAGASWKHKNFSLSASWSHGIGDNPGRSAFGGANADGSTRRHQFWLSGSIRF
ncbi:MAG: ShlB/FhaC/HecB family hemolysin secretion/activation protein [Sphingorhabdus sp.]|nr:ShlB/FhaC/HecB family hemolysin secretion/activation protein [Sphingorhabdus sp.]